MNGARLVTAIGVAIGSLVVGAIVLALVDLYIGGHGGRPLGHRPLFDADTLGVHVSVADAILLFVVLASVAATLWSSRAS
jgi:hypothetical protein